MVDICARLSTTGSTIEEDITVRVSTSPGSGNVGVYRPNVRSFITYFAIASPGSDYNSALMNLTFDAGDGDTDERCLTVIVNPDTLIEGRETFTVSLTLVTTGMGVTAGTNTTTVTIINGNCKKKTWFSWDLNRINPIVCCCSWCHTCSHGDCC